MRPVLIALLATVALCACIDKKSAQKVIESVQASQAPPDDLPVLLNTQPPFHYPPRLFARKVQANLMLHIHIDSAGTVWPESTKVLQSSGYPGLDSAAVKGSLQLRFRPARTRGIPVGVSINLPVYFRHPGEPPLPGDSVLHRAPPSRVTP